MKNTVYYIYNTLNREVVKDDNKQDLCFLSKNEANIYRESLKNKTKNDCIFESIQKENDSIFGFDFNTLFQNDLFSIYLEDDQYKIYDSDGNYFETLGSVETNLSDDIAHLNAIIENNKIAFRDIILCCFFSTIFNIEYIVPKEEFLFNKYDILKINNPDYINRFGNYYIILKEI